MGTEDSASRRVTTTMPGFSLLSIIILSGSAQHRHLPSFPTRRSSDLPHRQRAAQRAEPACRVELPGLPRPAVKDARDRKSTRLNSSHVSISYAVFCLKKKKRGGTYVPIATSPSSRGSQTTHSTPYVEA